MAPPDKIRPSDSRSTANEAADWAEFDAITDAKAEANAAADPDAPPAGNGKPLHRIAQAKRIRFDLRLTQQEFTDGYHIPLAVFITWERHEAVPDAVATAFLDAIEADPLAVAAALARSKVAAAE
jgi:DNA-binding transcriptional regulator YiaG